MLDAISHVGMWVRDQDEAKAFYTEKLGFEVRDDVTLDGGYRWLTVGPAGQADLNVILAKPGPPAVDAEAADEVLALVAKGAVTQGILRADDARATCRELEARGVDIVQQPEEQFYGIDGAIRDPSGNLWRIVQPLEYDMEEVRGRDTAAT
jgi:catechol 2,3-dioxygenase-like lactoylglutathione lyase family enzyme